LNRLQTILDSTLASDRSGDVWLLAGKYSAFLERYELAVEWAQKAVKHDNKRYQALLDLAEYQVLREQYTAASETLDRYLLGRSGSTAARSWTIRGRLLRQTESDSEAYLSYSHIIRNYPNSLELAEAENAIDELPLPSAFKPTGNGQASFSSTDRNNPSSRSVSKETGDGDWIVQLGSFLSIERAKEFKRNLQQNLGWPITISAATVDGRRYHRVQITGLASEQKATEVKRQLQQRGHDAFILEG
jgi:tetratricopeptide (TPR) repeat protein